MEKTKIDRPVLIVDVLNLFIRSHAAFPQMNTNGEPAGGYIGFLKTMRRIVSETGAKAIYVAWEGGGSSRRRAIFSEYKLKVKPQKLNRFYEDDIPSTEENKKHQMFVLLSALKCLPVCQLYVSDAEGDDLIAYLCEGPLRNEQRIIVSSDRDFFQLLNDKTKIYNLHKKNVFDKEYVLSEFRISANNFAVAKSICGDDGDNVPGVKGIGFKTLSKLFPMLGLTQDVSLDEVFSYCHTHLGEKPAFKKILDEEKNIRRNWRLVYLNGNMISSDQINKIDRVINDFKPTVKKIELIKLFNKEGIIDFNVNEFVHSLHGLEGLEYKTK